MSSLFSLIGALAVAYIMFRVVRSLSYGAKVRFYMTSTGLKYFGDAITEPFGRSMAHVMGGWHGLLTRLKARGLEPHAAAVIAATWLRDNAPDIPQKEKLQYMLDIIATELREEYQEELAKRVGYERSMDMAHTFLDMVMVDEGII